MKPAFNIGTTVVLTATFWIVTNGLAFGQENWPQFRGTNGLGVSQGQPPIKWDVESGKNILWKAPIEGLGHSAPVIWGDRIFLTTAASEKQKAPSLKTGWVNGSGDAADDSGTWHWKTICVSKKTGKILWTQTARSGEPIIQRHMKASHANCTPATNGKFVVSFFGSEGLYCYDMQGKLAWKKDLGRLHSGPYNMKKLEWGFASSPVIYQGKVVVQCDCLNTGFVAIFDLESGKEVKRIERKDVATWSSPCIFRWKGKTQLVCNGYKQMTSYDFDSGKELWTLSGGGDVPVPTPLFHQGLIYITNGHGRSPTYAISPDAKGDITPKKDEPTPEGLVWYQRRGGSYMPTPILVDDLLYTCNDNGVLTTREAKTGKQVYRVRAAQFKNNFSASAVATKNYLYFSSESGKILIAKTGKKFERVGSNDMKEVVMATPAISGDQLFIRTTNHLYCISKK